MTALATEIRERIRRDGPISVDAYMALCFNHPEHGYYRRGRPIGAGGDFITAPEVSQMFGELIGLWCAAVWQSMGRPGRVALVELGPGRGTLLADALRAAKTLPPFRDAIEVHLVESSASLRAEQADRYSPMPDRRGTRASRRCRQAPFWSSPTNSWTPCQSGSSSESAASWRERVVTLSPSARTLRFAAMDAACAEAAGLGIAPAGAIAERAPAREALATTLAARIEAEGGAALIVDYGHERPGLGDTLQAVKRHRRHDVLADPGTADLTAHVDFSALAAAAQREGANVFGPVPQGRFLRTLGIDARAARLRQDASPEQAAEIDAALRRLTGAHGMGALFKAMAISHTGRWSPCLDSSTEPGAEAP